MISTPNPFYFGTVIEAWKNGPMVANFEHTCWLSESNMLEISRRYELEICKIGYPIGKSSKNIFIALLRKISYKFNCLALFTSITYELKFTGKS